MLVDSLPKSTEFDASLDMQYRQRFSTSRVRLPRAAPPTDATRGPSSSVRAESACSSADNKERGAIKRGRVVAPPEGVPNGKSSLRPTNASIDERRANCHLDGRPSISSSTLSSSLRPRPDAFSYTTPSSYACSRSSLSSFPSLATPRSLPSTYPGIPEDTALLTDPRTSSLSPCHRVLNRDGDGKLHMTVTYAEAQMLLSVRKRRLAMREQDFHNGWVHASQDESKELREMVASESEEHADWRGPGLVDTRHARDVPTHGSLPDEDLEELEASLETQSGYGLAI